MNDPQFVEASRVLAQDIMRSEDDLDVQMSGLIQRILGRKSRDGEVATLSRLYDDSFERFQNSPRDASQFVSVGEITSSPST